MRAGNGRLVKRISAVLHLGEGLTAAEAAERVVAGENTVYAWLRAFIPRRCESLRYSSSPRRPRKLTPTQRARLRALVTVGPQAAGYPSGCWSALMLQDLGQREVGVCYNAPSLCALLQSLGFSYQKARFISDHLDEERRRVWIAQEWPALLRLARQRGAVLLFGDAVSVAQWDSLSYTWAPIGQQPLIKTCGKRKVSKVFDLIDYVTGRLFSPGQTARFAAATYGAFLTTVLEQTDRPLMLIRDRGPVSHGARDQGVHGRARRSRERLSTALLLTSTSTASIKQHARDGQQAGGEQFARAEFGRRRATTPTSARGG